MRLSFFQRICVHNTRPVQTHRGQSSDMVPSLGLKESNDMTYQTNIATGQY